LLSFWKANRGFFDEHYGVSANATSEPESSLQNENSRRSSDPEALYSLTLPERATKSERYLVVKDYGIPPKDRWFDLKKITSHFQDAQTKLWTITGPRRQFEERGVIEDALPLHR
jgi:hypothetical protein